MNNSTVPRTRGTRTASILNVLAGLWLIVSPFVLGYTALPVARWDTIIVGIIVLVLAGTRAANPQQYVGLSWLNLLLGIWLIVSPFALSYATLPRPTWNDVILGVVVVILAICSAVATPAAPQLARR
jgi:hypothetical protein